jgi:hypothetical protein
VRVHGWIVDANHKLLRAGLVAASWLLLVAAVGSCIAGMMGAIEDVGSRWGMSQDLAVVVALGAWAAAMAVLHLARRLGAGIGSRISAALQSIIVAGSVFSLTRLEASSAPPTTTKLLMLCVGLALLGFAGWTVAASLLPRRRGPRA